MKFLRKLLSSRPRLSLAQAARLAVWRDLPKMPTNSPLDATRFVVVDVESSGLNLDRDHLIALGAVAIVDGKIDMADSFEVVLQQTETSTHENILIHGIGGTAQRNGVPPVEAILSFLEYLGKSPLVAFHVTFDEAMIRNAIRQFLGFRFKHDWLDLAYVVPGLYPEFSRQYRLLDDWQNHFGIQNPMRHNAVSDALSTAQLFLLASRQARKKRIDTFHGLLHVEKAQRWVSWQT